MPHLTSKSIIYGRPMPVFRGKKVFVFALRLCRMRKKPSDLLSRLFTVFLLTTCKKSSEIWIIAYLFVPLQPNYSIEKRKWH